MRRTILKCTFLFVESDGNCVWVFPFSKPNTVVYKELVTELLLSLSVKEQLLPMRFTDSAFFLLHRMVLNEL